MNPQHPDQQAEFDFTATPPPTLPAADEEKIIDFSSHLQELKRKAATKEILTRASTLVEHLKEL